MDELNRGKYAQFGTTGDAAANLARTKQHQAEDQQHLGQEVDKRKQAASEASKNPEHVFDKNDQPKALHTQADHDNAYKAYVGTHTHDKQYQHLSKKASLDVDAAHYLIKNHGADDRKLATSIKNHSPQAGGIRNGHGQRQNYADHTVAEAHKKIQSNQSMEANTRKPEHRAPSQAQTVKKEHQEVSKAALAPQQVANQQQKAIEQHQQGRSR